jgi:hypothetical protein
LGVITLAPTTIKRFHRASASLLALFIFLHLLNHLALAAGSDIHLLIMSALRSIYRWWPFEIILLLAAATQMFTGVYLALPRLTGMIKRRDWQVLSGLYLAAFLMIHIGAVLWGRIHQGLDTNLWFGAAGFQVWPWMLFFIPYYGFAIIAFATHMGFVMRRVFGLNAVLPAFVLGAIVAAIIITLMSGLLQPLDVPDAYLASYR